MPNYNNILDMIGEGIRESNPIYRQKMEQQRQEQARMAEITQQQLFQANQHANDRSTLTEFEKQQLAQQESGRQQTMKEHYEGAVAGGKAIFTDANGNPADSDLAPQQSPAQKAVAAPAATGAGDAATNGMGGAGGNGPQGALTPTSASASAAPTGGIGDSGGGPSAPPIWKNPFDDILPQGPLIGPPGGAPAGNTSANTQQSRASSAQAGPLAQINQGSVTPSETASGQTGMDSGAQPSASAGSIAVRKPDVKLPDGRYVRFLTPQEQDTIAQKQARANAVAQRQISMEGINAFAADPANAGLIRDNPNLIAGMRMQAQTGIKPPISSTSALANAYADAVQSGDTPRADALAKAMALQHTPRSGGDQNLGGFLGSGMDQPAVDKLAINFNKTGQMPAMGMGNPALRRAVFQRASDLDPSGDLASAQAGYKSDAASLNKLKSGYDAMNAFETTGKKNLEVFLGQADQLVKKYADVGVPLLNTPIRDVQKLLGQEDIPAYQAARQTAINEIARVTQNPNLVGVMPLGAQKEISSFVPDNATLGQLQEVAKVLTQDMDNRKVAYESQIARVTDRIKNKTTVGQENVSTPPSTVPPPATTSTLKPLTKEIGLQYLKNNGGDNAKARAAAKKDGYDISKVVQ